MEGVLLQNGRDCPFSRRRICTSSSFPSVASSAISSYTTPVLSTVAHAVPVVCRTLARHLHWERAGRRTGLSEEYARSTIDGLSIPPPFSFDASHFGGRCCRSLENSHWPAVEKSLLRWNGRATEAANPECFRVRAGIFV